MMMMTIMTMIMKLILIMMMIMMMVLGKMSHGNKCWMFNGRHLH